MSTEEKTASVYCSESMPKFLSVLANQAVEDSGEVANFFTPEDMEVMLGKAVAMEDALQEFESAKPLGFDPVPAASKATITIELRDGEYHATIEVSEPILHERLDLITKAMQRYTEARKISDESDYALERMESDILFHKAHQEEADERIADFHSGNATHPLVDTSDIPF